MHFRRSEEDHLLLNTCRPSSTSDGRLCTAFYSTAQENAVKRCNQYLLLGCLAAWLYGGNAWADDSYNLWLTPSSGYSLTGVDPGDTIKLDLHLRYNDPAILGVTFDVAFTDTDLAYVSYSNVASISGWVVDLTQGLMTSPVVYNGYPDPDSTVLAYFQTTTTDVMATLEFTILGTTTATSTSLSFDNINIWSETLNDYMPLESGSATGATLTINQPSPVPVPSTFLLLGTGLAGLAALGRRRHGGLAS